MAAEMGTSSATLLRVEQGNICDSGTFASIMLWLIGNQKAGKKP